MDARLEGGNAGEPRSLATFRSGLPRPQIEFAHEQGYYAREGGFDFWAALKTVAHRKWLILAVLVAGLAIATVYVLSQTPLYRATTSLEIQKQEAQIVAGSDVQPAVVADNEFMVTQNELLQSRSLAERVAETLDLPNDKRYVDLKATRDQRLSQAADVLQRGLQVAPVPRSRVINIHFVSPYPAESARVANAFSEGFIESNLERKFNATAYARNFLEERLKTTKDALEISERKLVEYARQNNLVDLGSGKAAEVGDSLDASSLIALNTARTEAENARILAEHKYLEAKDSPSALQTLSSEIITELKNRRAAMSAEYQEKLATFKPDFPAMLELKARIDGADKEIAAERTNIVRALEADFKAAKSREEALKARVSELSGSLQTERDTRIDYNILRRDVDTNRSQYEALLQRLKEVSIASGIGSSQVAIVDRAQTPEQAFSPNVRSTLLRALIFSLIAALALAFALEYIDDTIKTPADVKAKLGLACIGVIPKIAADLNVVDEVRNPKSRVAEAFFSARTALQFSTSNGTPGSVLLTGTRPAEGKTSAAVGLALAYTGVGDRVLIIDADMRKPSFASPQNKSVGLSGLLTTGGAVKDNVVPGEVARLHLLPTGVVPPNPAELLSSPRLSQIILEAQNQYDLVIVDGPPVLHFADSLLLASACDGAVIVMQAGAIRRPAALETIERLAESRATILGAILSKFESKRQGYGYGYGYAEGYQTGEGGDRRAGEAESRRRIRLFSSAGRESESSLPG